MRSIFGKVLWVGRATVFAVGLAVMLGLLLAASPAHAKTFTVNSTEDFSDIDPGDGICDTLSSKFLNPCTLRGAIQEANKFAGADTINFDIPGAGVKTISPNSQLPEITRRVTIDGYTQPGATKNTIAQGASNAIPLIELDGTNAGSSSHGLLIIGDNASNTVIKGLVINRFGNNGIHCCLGGKSTGIRVKGNFIGTNASGTQDLGNANSGVAFTNPSNNTVGGTLPEDRNVISGNDNWGVALFLGSDSNVEGNLIGTAKNGTADLGNTSDGVAIGGDNNTVGGTASGAANVIAHNVGDGVKVNTGLNSGNRILSNSIDSNGDLGIDLDGGTEDANGVTDNDPKDPDTGANNLQNYPILTVIQTIGNQVTLTGTLNSRPEKKFTIQFFSSPQEDPSDSGEGKTFLGQKKVETNKKGNASFTFTAEFPAGEFYMTATATGRGGTSEFSNSILEI